MAGARVETLAFHEYSTSLPLESSNPMIQVAVREYLFVVSKSVTSIEDLTTDLQQQSMTSDHPDS